MDHVLIHVFHGHALWRAHHVLVIQHDGGIFAFHDRADELPHHLFITGHFEKVAVLGGRNQIVAVGQFLRCALAVAEEAVAVIGGIFPHDLAGGHIHFQHTRTVGFGALGAVVENGHEVFTNHGSMVRAENNLGLVVIPCGGLALAVGRRVAPAPFNFACLFVHKQRLGEVARIHQHFIVAVFTGHKLHRVEVRPVVVVITNASFFGYDIVGVKLILARAYMICEMPFPNGFAVFVHFAHKIHPEIGGQLAAK